MREGIEQGTHVHLSWMEQQQQQHRRGHTRKTVSYDDSNQTTCMQGGHAC
jgi:hypothetical protein